MPDRIIPPRWPRLLSESDAASYVGVSLNTFRAERVAGIWPSPVDRNSRRVTYDRAALDRAVDRLSGWRDDPATVEDELIGRTVSVAARNPLISYDPKSG